MNRLFPNAVIVAQRLVSWVAGEEDAVVDATAGNGLDTLFLADVVGPNGRVYAFDVQHSALDLTRKKLDKEGMLGRVELISAGHENMERHVRSEVKAVMFNLGYLPGGNHSFTTQAETTVSALRASCSLAAGGGLITIVIYTGHEGGRTECAAVEEFTSSLPQSAWDVTRIDFPNRRSCPPYLVALQKR